MFCLRKAAAQRGLAVLVPHAPAVVPEDGGHEAVAVVRPVQGLAEAVQILGRVLRLLGELDHVGVVDLGHLEALGLHDVLADEEHAGHRVARDAEELAVRPSWPARRRAGARPWPPRSRWPPCSRRAVPPCSASARRCSSRPRSGGLPASMAATNFCSRSPKVAQSISTSTFFSFAHASTCLASTSLPAVTKLLKSQTRSLVFACAGGHAAQRVQPRRGATGDDGRLAKELAAGDETCVELLGQILEAIVHEGAPPLERVGQIRGWPEC